MSSVRNKKKSQPLLNSRIARNTLSKKKPGTAIGHRSYAGGKRLHVNMT